MAWSWSHSDEGIANAEANLRLLPKTELEIIFAEWRAAQGKGGVIDFSDPAWNQKRYDRALVYAKTLDDETLADFIWERASEMATCENGGFEAWMCPYGCGPHCVSFSPPEETDEEAELEERFLASPIG